jgi:very-short-patch-repair endonuclease
MTPEESLLWEHLRNDQLNGLHFRRQQVIDGFIADFYCHVAHLVIEIDGGIHDVQIESDAERDAALSSKGFIVIHFRNEEVNTDLDSVLERILALSLPPFLLREGGQGG